MTGVTDRRILVVGTMALDTVENDVSRSVDALGGSATYFAMAAALLAPVSLVGVVGNDFPVGKLMDLIERGVDLSGLQRGEGATFRWSVRYRGGRRETLSTNRDVAVGAVPRVPEELRRPWALFLGSTDPAVQAAVLDQVEGPEVVALDTMSHWIVDRRDDLVALLPRVDLLLVNDEEAELLGGHGDLAVAAEEIRRLGPRWVVVKRGAAGASAYGPDGVVSVPAAPVVEVADPTGAGDAFAGGLLGRLAAEGALDGTVLPTALRTGALAASLAIATFSVMALAAAGPGDVSPDG